MALALILLLKQNTSEFVHMENLILSKGHKRCGDFSYLTWYNHIEKMNGDRPDGSAKNGHYRIKPAGIAFAEGRATVSKKFIMVGGDFKGFEGKQIDIYEALGTKFSYNELMGELP